MCNKELKIHQKKEKIYIYIQRERERERERERKYSHVCVGKIQIVWNREKLIFIVKKKGEEESK